MIPWTHIMIHHSLTKDTDTVSWAAIRKYHVNNQRWHDIGYHFGVEFAGNEYEALVGRPLDLVGAHCKEGGMNEKAIGICVVGNFDLYAPNEMIIDVLCKRLIKPLSREFGIEINSNTLVFHREFATYKTCPGTFFTKDLILRRFT